MRGRSPSARICCPGPSRNFRFGRRLVSPVSRPDSQAVKPSPGHAVKGHHGEPAVRYRDRIEVGRLNIGICPEKTSEETEGHERRIRPMQKREYGGAHRGPDDRIGEGALDPVGEKSLEPDLLEEAP